MTNFPGTRQQPGVWQGAPCPSIRAESLSAIRSMAMKTRVSGQPTFQSNLAACRMTCDGGAEMVGAGES